MKIFIEAEVAELDALLDRLASRLVLALSPMFEQETKLMAQIDDEIATLTADVAALTTTTGSAVALIDGISAKITAAVDAALAAGATPAQLQAITDANTALQTQTAALAAAVSANTPAAATP